MELLNILSVRGVRREKISLHKQPTNISPCNHWIILTMAAASSTLRTRLMTVLGPALHRLSPQEVFASPGVQNVIRMSNALLFLTDLGDTFSVSS